MRNLILSIAISATYIALHSTALGCLNDYQCSTGSVCKKAESYDIEGVCVGTGGSLQKQEDKEIRPIQLGKTGESCTNDYQCGTFGKCLKADAYSLAGTCSR